MLHIQTFDARAGGNVIYKALAHPLAAEAHRATLRRLARRPVALYDPDGIAEPLLALYPDLPGIGGAVRARRGRGRAAPRRAWWRAR